MIPERTVVVRRGDGRRGVVVPDPFKCCSASETPVVYEGEEGFLGTPTEDLRVLGPENAKPDPRGCGVGLGANCCIFLTTSPDGFECERHGRLRYRLIFKKRGMAAKRQPTAPWPECMDQAEDGPRTASGGSSARGPEERT